MEQYLQETEMLDYSDSKLQQLIADREWKKLDNFHCIRQIYE
jgi:hypothetical protein